MYNSQIYLLSFYSVCQETYQTLWRILGLVSTFEKNLASVDKPGTVRLYFIFCSLIYHHPPAFNQLKYQKWKNYLMFYS